MKKLNITDTNPYGSREHQPHSLYVVPSGKDDPAYHEEFADLLRKPSKKDIGDYSEVLCLVFSYYSYKNSNSTSPHIGLNMCLLHNHLLLPSSLGNLFGMSIRSILLLFLNSDSNVSVIL